MTFASQSFQSNTLNPDSPSWWLFGTRRMKLLVSWRAQRMSSLSCSAVTLLLPCWTSNCFFSQNALASGFSFIFPPGTGCLRTPAYLNLALSSEADGGDMVYTESLAVLLLVLRVDI